MINNISNVIKKRVSVRTYEDNRLSDNDKKKVNEVILSSSNPFNAQVIVHYVEKDEAVQGKLGTYGTIKGASSFLGLSVIPGENALIGAGYQFEQIILELTNLGLGTVWLAATFSRDNFAKAMDINEDELFIAISPLGYPYEKRSIVESVMRRTLKSNNRKDWNELFFDSSFNNPLTKEQAGHFENALDMLRLAPSATNSQPWRVVKEGVNTFHFYETHKAKISEEELMIKQIDLGIALCHFDLVTQEEGIVGSFEKNEPQNIIVPEHTNYVMSWKVA